MTTEALQGVRVLDMTNFFAGPHCTMLLADLGAEVIKVESPPQGDPIRYREDETGYSPSFVAKNRNKHSLFLDLSRPEGRAALARIIPQVDVLVTSLRPKARAKLGMDYAHAAALNPRLVYCSLTGYGETGAATDRPVFDTAAQAISGLLSVITTDFDAPMRIQAFFSDLLAGTYAAYGVMAALMARAETGRGQEVRTSLLRASMAFADSAFLHAMIAKRTGTARGRLQYRTAGFLFTAGDGRPFAVHVAPSPPKNWIGFVNAMEMPGLANDTRFNTKQGREENYVELHAILSNQAKSNDRAYWLDRLEAQDVPAAPVNQLAEVFEDPIAGTIGMLHDVQDERGQTWPLIGSGIELSDTPIQPFRPAPRAGENTEELLAKFGFSPEEAGELQHSYQTADSSSVRKG